MGCSEGNTLISPFLYWVKMPKHVQYKGKHRLAGGWPARQHTAQSGPSNTYHIDWREV